MAISYSQISRLGSQEIWKRDFVYVDDLAILSSAYARFVIGQEGGPGGGGARRGGGALPRFVRNDTFNLHWDEENHVDVPPKTDSEIVKSKQYTLFADQYGD